MDFMSVGSINTYLKNMDMQVKWQQNQKTGNYKPADKTEKYKNTDEWVSSQQEKSKEADEKKNKQLNDIKNKYSSGGKLTQQEMRYLQSNDPTAYAQMQAAESERRIYEYELQCCITKEDLHRYKLTHLAQAASNVKSIMNDKSMSLEEKFKAVAGEKKKIDAVNKAEQEFIKRGDYARLPSQAEKLKAERDMRRAKAEEQRAAREKEAAKRAERKEEAEAARQERKAREARLEQLRAEKKAARESGGTVTVQKKRPPARLKKPKKKVRCTKPRYTVHQAANTYEAKKLRSAYARASYARSYLSPSEGGTSDTEKKLDARA